MSQAVQRHPRHPSDLADAAIHGRVGGLHSPGLIATAPSRFGRPPRDGRSLGTRLADAALALVRARRVV